MGTLDRAVQIAAEAHQGQTDESGRPTILHVLKVTVACSSERARTVALLYGVLERTEWTIERLAEEGFDDDTISGVESLTRLEGEAYLKSIRRAARHPIGSDVVRAARLDQIDLADVPPPLQEEDVRRVQLHYTALQVVLDEDEKRQKRT